MSHLVLHGAYLNTHRAFAELADRLDGTYQVIAPDIRGFGRSVSPEPASHTWDQYVADMVSLLDHLGLTSAIIGGTSLGAGIATAVALRKPERVRALVIAQAAYAGDEVGHNHDQRSVWVQIDALVQESAIDGSSSAMVRGQADAAGRQWVREAVAQHDETSFLAAQCGEMGTAQPFRCLDDLCSIDVPVLLIPGDDPVHPPLITDMYGQHLSQVTRAKSSTMDPLTWVADLVNFATAVIREPPETKSLS